MSPRFVLPLAVVGALIALFVAGLQRDPQLLPSPLIGRAAPAFSLPAVPAAAARVSPADFRGQPVLVNFFASWCVECVAEHGALQELARHAQVRLVGIDYKDTDEHVRRWLAERGNPYSVVVADHEGSAGLDWGVYGVPETFLVGADGRILAKHVGPLTEAVFQAELAPHLAAPR